MKKKKILFHSDFSKLKTGFGRNTREVLMHLWKTGKYDIVEYAVSPVEHDGPELKTVPWKCYGAIPTKSYHLQGIDTPSLQQRTRYGGFFIDDIIRKEKPDIYIGANDFWGFDGYVDKPWWNKFPCVLWITMDSLPLLTTAVKAAPNIKNFWVWTSFAEKEFHRLGHEHVKTIPGALDVKTFKPMPGAKKNLKDSFGIGDFQVFGFVFRNQLRKLVGSLLEGFKQYQQSDDYKPSKVLLHTNWLEGWDIPRFIKEFELKNEDVLTTFVCGNCKHFHISEFTGPQRDCPNCGGQKTCRTPGVNFGVTEDQLNLIYNLMDFYVHPITSGGLEMPLVEAMMAGLPAATVDYSCGSEFTDSGLVEKIDFTTYREVTTGFIKASTKPESICQIMKKFGNMGEGERQSLGSKGRAWAADKFDSEKICKQIEEFVDAQPETDYSYEFKPKQHNSEVPFDEEEKDDRAWGLKLIKDIFGVEEEPNGPTMESMMEGIKNDGRRSVYDKAIASAAAHNAHLEAAHVPKLFEKSPNGNVGFVSPANQIEKMFSPAIVQAVHEQTGKPVVIISDPIDPSVYSNLPCVKAFIPKNERSLNVEWLMDLQDEDDKPRFDLIVFQHGNEYTYQEQNPNRV